MPGEYRKYRKYHRLLGRVDKLAQLYEENGGAWLYRMLLVQQSALRKESERLTIKELQ